MSNANAVSPTRSRAASGQSHMTSDSLRARTWALNTAFFIPGVGLASWASRTPSIRDGLHASIEEMGWTLFGFSAGSMLGILTAGKLTMRIGPRSTVQAGLATLLLGIVGIGIAVQLSAVWLCFLGFVMVGTGMGWVDIGANIDGVELERLAAKPVLPACHGFFSLGTLIGAAVGMGLSAYGTSVLWHLGAVAVIALALTWHQIRHLADTVRQPDRTGKTSFWTEIYDARLLMIGFLCMALALAEGAANDWLPILMIDGHGLTNTAGVAVYMVFTASMTVGRFCGNWVVRRIGRAAVFRICTLSASLALALVIFSPSPWLTVCAIVLWGIGASLGFPLAMSAAGEGEGDTATRVSITATLGYMAFLVGPPMLGFLGERFGIRQAMLPVLAATLLAVTMASAGRELGKKRAS
ncbi:Fucose permease [Paracidovorax cattleyae]|uniref:Fucose permease n=3 Tax=Paracidovorax cattleyae TaxID=80868 RepID=A0A1H0L4E7_9BURK|nr:Fucose permease [Paracidovorax cattleyae]